MPSSDYREIQNNVRRGLVYTGGPTPSIDVIAPVLLGSIFRSRKIKSSVSTPGFRRLLTIGSHLPVNNYSYEEFTTSSTSGSQYVTTVVFGGVPQVTVYSYEGGNGVGYTIGAFTIPASDLNQTLINKAKGQQWNVPIFLYEGGKTMKMVVESATHLAHMANALRRGRFGDFWQAFHKSASRGHYNRKKKAFDRSYRNNAQSAAANAWLQYRYGWRPFMKDVQDATNTLMDIVDRPIASTGHASAYKSKSSDSSDSSGRIFVDTDVNLYVKGTVFVSTTESLRVKWRFSVNALDLPARLGLVNPLEVAWEALPLSFVADWFLPIGSYLSSFDTNYRFSFLSGSLGRRMHTSTVSSMTSIEGSGSGGGFSGCGTWTLVTRVATGGNPSMSVFDLRPKFDLGPAQVTSAIALLNQALSSLGSGRTKG